MVFVGGRKLLFIFSEGASGIVDASLLVMRDCSARNHLTQRLGSRIAFA
jgi:hypothetical protein